MFFSDIMFELQKYYITLESNWLDCIKVLEAHITTDAIL